MKKITISILLITIFALSVISIAHAASAGKSASTASVRAVLLNQEPDPVEPGEIATLRFKIENNGTATKEDVQVRLITGFPFTIYGSDKTKNIGALRARQTGSDAAIVEYKVRVDEAAIQGIEEVDVQVNMGDGWKTFEDFPIEIRTRDTILAVQAIKSTPEIIAPGSTFELFLTIKNEADSLARNVEVNLDLTGEDTPFAPEGSTAEKSVYKINEGTAHILRYDLIALPEADGGIYKIPINITYTDETGATKTQDDIISLRISSVPNLLAYIESSDITKKVKQGEMNIRIVNRGLTNIKLLTATLGEAEGLTTSTYPEVYVGDIDSDDYETATYDIKVSPLKKQIDIPLTLSFRDATNKEYTEERTVTLNTGSRGAVVTILTSISKTIFIIALLAVIAYGGYWFYKRRKNKAA